MRRIVATAHLSLDGVMQGPGSAEEDPTDGFDLGGWIWQFSDDKLGAAVIGMVGSPDMPNDLLLGRKTYDIFAGYWPHAPADNRLAVLSIRPTNLCLPMANKSSIGPTATNCAASTSSKK